MHPRTRAELVRMLAAARAQGDAACAELRAELSVNGRGAVEFGKTVDRKTRSARVVVTTERPVPMIDWERWEVVDEVLSMGGFSLPEGRQSVPMLDSHQRASIDNILGRLDEFKVVGDTLEATAHFDDGEQGEKALKLAESGTLTDFSAGYNVVSKVYVGDGAEVTIHGKKYTGPLNVATKWVLKEASACAIGADIGATIRSVEPRPSAGTPMMKGPTAMNRAELQKLLEKAIAEGNVEGMRTATAQLQALDALEASRRTAAAPAPAAAPATTPAPGGEGARVVDFGEEQARKLREEGARMETERRSEITTLGEMSRMPAEIVTKAIADGLTVDAARKVFQAEYARLNSLDDAARATAQPHAGARLEVGAEKDKESRVDAIFGAWGLRNGVLKPRGVLQLGTGNVIKPHERSGEFMGLTLSGLMRRSLRDAGVRGCEDLEGLSLYKAVQGNRTATSDLNNILGGVINKSLAVGWGLRRTSWRQIAKKRSAKDFNITRLISHGGTGLLRQVGEGGQVPIAEIGDGKYETIVVSTWADRMCITEEVFVNDDTGAFTDIPMQRGVMADQTVNHQVLYTLTQAANNVGPTMNEDGYALFDATNHVNYVTSGAAPSESTLSVLRANLRKQTRPSSVPDAAAVPLNLEPAFMLVPTKHETAARKLLSNEAIFLPGATNNEFNQWRGSLELVVEPVLDSGATVHFKTGSLSSTGNADGWYVGCDPAIDPALVVAFLNGNEAPVFEFARPLEFMGEEIRTSLRTGTAVQEWRTIQYNDGA